MTAAIASTLLGVLYSTLWFKYLRYRLYGKLSENRVFYELLLCKLCAGFWAGVLGTLTYFLMFGSSGLVHFLWIGFWEVKDFIVKLPLTYLAIIGGTLIFFETKIGALAHTYGNKVMSFVLALLFVFNPMIFTNPITALVFFGFAVAGLTFMIFKD
jgi:hypothetical protein